MASFSGKTKQFNELPLIGRRLLLIVFFSALLPITSLLSGNYSNNAVGIHTVVIDAGHGGKDPGCSGVKAKEKDITLAIALKLGKYIEEKLPDVKVIYTRKTDVFIELHERADIANRNNADLFISIHCNSNPSDKPYGTETYVMGLHKSEDNLMVAMRENESILKEENYATQYNGFNPNSPEAYIIFSLYQNAFLNQSINFASKVETEFKERIQRKSRGIYQAGFWVLYKTAMPSVLVETGFLSNKEEEKFLYSVQGQEYIASGIYRAFKDYKSEVEANSSLKGTMRKDTTEISTQKISIENSISPAQDSSTTILSITEKKDSASSSNTSAVLFRIQIGIMEKSAENTDPRFSGLSEMKSFYEPYENGLFKLMLGAFNTLEKAIEAQNKVREKGFNDAFVVAYNNNQRISLKEAQVLLGKTH